jgi:hypothetical protein
METDTHPEEADEEDLIMFDIGTWQGCPSLQGSRQRQVAVQGQVRRWKSLALLFGDKIMRMEN